MEYTVLGQLRSVCNGKENEEGHLGRCTQFVHIVDLLEDLRNALDYEFIEQVMCDEVKTYMKMYFSRDKPSLLRLECGFRPEKITIRMKTLVYYKRCVIKLIKKSSEHGAPYGPFYGT